AGRPLDELVGGRVLAALEPAALELSLAAADDLHQERARLHQLRRQELERAGYQAERARRQYDAAEPENRLVARELERRWEEALKEQRRLEEEYARFRQSQPEGLSLLEREQIRSLAGDVPALWHAATTTAADRQRIVRLLVEAVEVTVAGVSEQTEVTICWAGGHTSRHALVRPVQRYDQMSGWAQLLAKINELSRDNLSSEEIAARLNEAGFRPPKRSRTFNAGMVSRLLAKSGRCGPRPQAVQEAGLLRESEWLLSDLARK